MGLALLHSHGPRTAGFLTAFAGGILNTQWNQHVTDPLKIWRTVAVGEAGVATFIQDHKDQMITTAEYLLGMKLLVRIESDAA